MTAPRIAALLALTLSGCVLLAEDKKAAEKPADKPEEGFVSLFNGKDTTGWVVTACKVAAENGNLVALEGNGFVRSEKQYGDFVLELEWKNRQAAKFDSGIFFRSVLPLPKGRRWPNQWQVNLLQGKEGELVGHKQGKAAGLATAGEWNKLRLTVVGKTAEAQVNGKPAWKVEDIEPAVGYIGLQVEVPAGGQFEFRNIRVKPLTPPVDPPAEPAKE